MRYRLLIVSLMVTAFGLLAAMLFGKPDDLQQRLQLISRQGKNASATITNVNVSNRPMQQIVYYRYTLGSIAYEGVADTRSLGRRTYLIGDPITVTYLPSHPSVSTIDPTGQLEHIEKGRHVALYVATVGGMGSVLCIVWISVRGRVLESRDR